ncbi:MAG TPA: GNAT family N-acetyltransferase [Bryobacteraceae bacterium]|nr:GNAT family N-acetyltransferase [Bryobacteraceae bacterium]
MSTIIRSATVSDVAVILDLIRQLAEYEQQPHLLAATEGRLRETLFGARPAAEVLLADSKEECAGFAVFFANYSTYLAQPGIYLEDLYVKAHARGRGVGSALLRRVAAIAIERGCARVEWGVLDWNQASIRFYRNLGAEPLPDWTKYRLTGQSLEKLAYGGPDGPGA